VRLGAAPAFEIGAACDLQPTMAREVTLGVRPADLRLASTGLPARVELIEELGDSRIVNLVAEGLALKMKCDNTAALCDGQSVHLGLAPASAHLFDRQTGQRLN
jgi:ABC-type sugar transport system ATPase subunit